MYKNIVTIVGTTNVVEEWMNEFFFFKFNRTDPAESRPESKKTSLGPETFGFGPGRSLFSADPRDSGPFYKFDGASIIIFYHYYNNGQTPRLVCTRRRESTLW